MTISGDGVPDFRAGHQRLDCGGPVIREILLSAGPWPVPVIPIFGAPIGPKCASSRIECLGRLKPRFVPLH